MLGKQSVAQACIHFLQVSVQIAVLVILLSLLRQSGSPYACGDALRGARTQHHRGALLLLDVLGLVFGAGPGRVAIAITLVAAWVRCGVVWAYIYIRKRGGTVYFKYTTRHATTHHTVLHSTTSHSTPHYTILHYTTLPKNDAIPSGPRSVGPYSPAVLEMMTGSVSTALVCVCIYIFIYICVCVRRCM
jgi:hypothetical protein